MDFGFLVAGNFIESRNVTPGANEQIIEGEQALSIFQPCFRQCHFPQPRSPFQYPGDHYLCLVRQEWQEYPIKSAWLRIHGDNGLVSHIFGSVGYQAILSQSYDQVVFQELESRNQATINQLLRHFKLQRFAEPIEGAAISVVFTLIVRKITASVFYIELCLRSRIEALYQFLQS